MSLREHILFDARADDIPEDQAGLWTVKKFATRGAMMKPTGDNKRMVWLPPGHYTQLWRSTEATMHLLGELVMQDTPEELNTHLEFMLRAHGRVLINGLGLGCVLRGCLANPAVKYCVVIERDPRVVKLVAPFILKDRYTIILSDAVDWCSKAVRKFDCAWHDLWSDPDKNEQHLQLTHAQLIGAMTGHCKFQGAWNMPRHFRRLFRHSSNVI